MIDPSATPSATSASLDQPPTGNGAPEKRPCRDRDKWGESEIDLAVQFFVRHSMSESDIAAGLHRTTGAVAELFDDLRRGRREYPARTTLRLPAPPPEASAGRSMGVGKKQLADLAAELAELKTQIAALAGIVGPRLDRLRTLFTLIEQCVRVLVASAIDQGFVSVLDLSAVGLHPDEGIQIARLAAHLGHRHVEVPDGPVGDPAPGGKVPLVITGQGDGLQELLPAQA